MVASGVAYAGAHSQDVRGEGMIYVDEVADYGKVIRGHGPHWAHLGTDDHTPEGVEILHAFARRLGLKRAWFQNKPDAPHYESLGAQTGPGVALGGAVGDSCGVAEVLRSGAVGTGKDWGSRLAE